MGERIWRQIAQLTTTETAGGADTLALAEADADV